MADGGAEKKGVVVMKQATCSLRRFNSANLMPKRKPSLAQSDITSGARMLADFLLGRVRRYDAEIYYQKVTYGI